MSDLCIQTPSNKISYLKDKLRMSVMSPDVEKVIYQLDDIWNCKISNQQSHLQYSYVNSTISDEISKWKQQQSKKIISKKYNEEHLYDYRVTQRTLKEQLQTMDITHDMSFGIETHRQQIEKSSLIPIEYLSDKKQTYLKQQRDNQFVEQVKGAQRITSKFRQDQKSRESRQRVLHEKEQTKMTKDIEVIKEKQTIEQEYKAKQQEELKYQIVQRVDCLKKNRAKSKLEMESRSVKGIPLYKKMEGIYSSDIVLPDLNEKKKILSEIRELHKPISKNTIMEHAQRMEINVREKNLKKQINRDNKIVENLMAVTKYKSKMMTKIAMYDQIKASEQQSKKKQDKELYKKRLNYSNFVKEMHKPDKSEKKELEMQIIKEGRKQANRSMLGQVSQRDSRQISFESHDSLLRIQETPKVLKKLNWKKINPMIPKAKMQKQGGSFDWLKQKRELRTDNDQKTLETIQLQKDLKDETISKYEKAVLVEERVKQMEEEYNRREVRMRTNQSKTIEDEESANNILLVAMRAKLALVEELC